MDMKSNRQTAVFFRYNERRPPIADKQLLKQQIKIQFAPSGKKLESLCFIFCSDSYLLEINRQFLKHDYYTDIITFNLSGDPDTIQAEVYISVDRVRENARQHNVPFKHELLRVIFHGVLHLLGYRDKSKSEMAQMRNLETGLIGEFLKAQKKVKKNAS
jgi:rRNA maturation RNase YbeY